MRPFHIVQCLAAALPVLAAEPAPADGWDRLARVSSAHTVKVHLRDGRVLRGSIQQVGSDDLGLLLEARLTRVNTRSVDSTVLIEDGEERLFKGCPSLRRGAAVKLTLRDGAELEGTVQRFNEREASLWLAESDAIERIRRADVLRVTKRSRGMTALAGLAGGAALGLLIPKDSLAPGESAAGLTVAYAAIPALIGAGIGAIIGYTQTLYRAAPEN